MTLRAKTYAQITYLHGQGLDEADIAERMGITPARVRQLIDLIEIGPSAGRTIPATDEPPAPRRGGSQPGRIGTQPHGTQAAVQRHYRAKEPVCPKCQAGQLARRKTPPPETTP